MPVPDVTGGWIRIGAVFALLLLGLGVVLFVTPRPVPDHPFFEGTRPWVIAHRGGSGLWPENTLHAFRRALALGVDVVELDVRRTADDSIIVLHDAAVDRTTDGRGPIRDMTLAEAQKLDAAFHWSRDGGESFPFRGKGFRIPTLEETLNSFPHARLNIEIKETSGSLAVRLCQTIREHGREENVLVASFDSETLEAFREQCPNVATSASAAEVRWFLRLSWLSLERLYRGRALAFQVPPKLRNVEIVTPDFVQAARDRNIRIQVWTVNEIEEMRRMLSFGVDGLLTDYPDRLLHLLGRGETNEPSTTQRR